MVERDGVATIPWVLFFNSIFQGDTGTDFEPTFANLTTVGTPTITGKYYLLSRQICYFSIRIVPGTSVTATAGSTAVTDFPLQFTADGACLAVSGLTGSNAGMISATDQKIYIPALSAVTVPVTIVGLAEVL
jgi:hypothetical protein